MGKDVIVALDFDSKEKTLAFLDRFTAEKPFVKIGMELFYAEGPSIVREIRARGHKIFLDLKLHDIPNTVKKAMAALILFLMETLLFYLYEMPLEAWAYSSVFILLIFGGWIILDGVQQRKKYKQLKNIQKEAEVYLETEHFGKPENAVEKEYQNLAEMLGRQWENARQEARCQISEANRYYIRWSHQIKTPIAALRLLLEEEEPDRAAMEGEIYRIEQYVEFALQYQRLEGGHKDLVFAHYSLESIVKKALKKTGVLFRRTKLALELGNLQTDVLTDEKWLVFVLEQLLTNASKYTKEGGSVWIGKENGLLVLRDTGIGIRPEDLPRIFEWGYTGYNGRLDKRSTGVGLALVKQVMEMLGNKIEIRSVLGEGTEAFQWQFWKYII